MLKTVMRHSFILAIGAALGRLFPYAFILWSSTTLAHLQYNTVSAIFMWSTVAATLVATGISTVMAQRIARESDSQTSLSLVANHYLLILLATSAFSLLTFFYGFEASQFLFHQSVQPGLYEPATLAGWAWPQVMFFVTVLNATRRGKAAALLIAVGGVLQGAGMFIGSQMTSADSTAITWGFAIGSTCAVCVGAIIVKQVLFKDIGVYKIFRLLDFRSIRGSRSSMLFNTLASSAVMPVGFLAGSLIAKSKNGVSELAQYYFLEQISQLIIYFPALAGQVLMPYVSRHLHEISTDQKIKLIRSSCRKIFLLFLICTVLSILLGFIVEPVIRIIHSNHLGIEAVWATRWMLYNATLTLPLTVLGALLIGAGHIKFGSLTNVVWGACVLTGTQLLVDFGNAGFQASRVVASLMVLMLGVSFLLFTNSSTSMVRSAR